MSISVTFCDPDPQDRFRSVIQEAVDRGTEADVVTAFMTKAGVDLLTRWARALGPKRCRLCVSVQFPTNLDALVPLSRLLGDRLFIHLGSKTPEEKAGKAKISPLLHSKIIRIGHGTEAESIFVGSHNWTSKALDGANLEASTRLVCKPDDPFATDVRAHIEACVLASEVFNPADLDFYKSIQWELYSDGPQQAGREIIEQFVSADAVVIHAEDHRPDRPIGPLQLYLPLPVRVPLDWFQPLDRTVYLYLYPPGTLLGQPTPTADPFYFEGKVKAVSNDLERPIHGREVNSQIADLTAPILETVGGNIPKVVPRVAAQVLANLHPHGTAPLPVFVAERARPGVRVEPQYEEAADLSLTRRDADPLPSHVEGYYADGSVSDGHFVYQTPHPRKTTVVHVPGVQLYRTPPERTIQEVVLRGRETLHRLHAEVVRRREADVIVTSVPADTRFVYIYPVTHVLRSPLGSPQQS